MTFERLLELAREYQDWEEWSGLLYLETIDTVASLPDESAARRLLGRVRGKHFGEQRFGGGDHRWRRLRQER